MKNNHNAIECCNNTHQGAPHTAKQTCVCASDLGDGSYVLLVITEASVYYKIRLPAALKSLIGRGTADVSLHEMT